jgi:hypothetical protein
MARPKESDVHYADTVLELLCASREAKDNRPSRLGLVRRRPGVRDEIGVTNAADTGLLKRIERPDGGYKVQATCKRCSARPQAKGERITAILDEMEASNSPRSQLTI